MSRFRVVVTATAVTDIAQQVVHIHVESSIGAARWYEGCLAAIQSLRSMPQRGRLAPEAEEFERPIRQLIYHSHRILFEISGETVNVLHVRHAARLPLTPDGGAARAEAPDVD